MCVLVWYIAIGVSGWDWLWIGLGLFLDFMKWSNMLVNRRTATEYGSSVMAQEEIAEAEAEEEV